MRLEMRVEGGEQLARNLRLLSDRVSRRVLREALTETIGEPVRQRAATMAPKDPGAPDLAAHMVISTARGKSGEAAIAVGPSKETRSDQPERTFDIQAWFVEHGTVHRPATPFLRPAFSEAPRHLGALGGKLWQALIARGFSTRGTSGGGVGL